MARGDGMRTLAIVGLTAALASTIPRPAAAASAAELRRDGSAALNKLYASVPTAKMLGQTFTKMYDCDTSACTSFKSKEAPGDMVRFFAEYLDENPEGVHIATACPAVAEYVRKYHPELTDRLVPIVSPMIATAMA